jgi:hypothetical protein
MLKAMARPSDIHPRPQQEATDPQTIVSDPDFCGMRDWYLISPPVFLARVRVSPIPHTVLGF